MDALCSKILTYSDWSEEEQGRAIAGVLGLTPEKVSVLTRLPEAVLKTSLHNLRAQGTEHPSALVTELKDVTATMKDLADKTASTDNKLTEIQEALARTATKKSKGFSDASSRDANEILEELSLIQVNGDKSELSKPSGKYADITAELVDSLTDLPKPLAESRARVKKALAKLGFAADEEVGDAFRLLTSQQLEDKGGLLTQEANAVLAALITAPGTAPQGAPAAAYAGTQPLSREGKQALLEAHFRQFFAQQQHFMLGEQSASLRSGQIAPDQRGLVKKVGSRFQLEGLDLPSTQLLLSLRQMNIDFINTGNVPKWRQTLQLFRLVAAPGQGKSTALQALWWQLGSLLDRKPELLDEPLDEMEALCDARLKQRIRNFLTSNRILVFVMDLSTGGLAQLTEDEQRTPTGAERSMAAVLAWRMLRACLLFPESDVRKTDYDAFVKSMPAALRDSLKPLDVVEFIVSAAGLVKTEASMVVFAYDEANSVTAPRAPTWFQKLLHEFVNLREAAAEEEAAGRLAAMPVVVTASTRASASSLAGTQSGKSKVKDLQLARLGNKNMQRIVEKFAERVLGIDRVTCPEHVASLIEWLGGNPRLLAQLLCALSGRTARAMAREEMHVGNPANAEWLEQRPDGIRPIIQALVTCMSAQWQAWLDGDKVSLLVKAFAHAVLGKLVKREGEVVAGQEVTWSQLESDNVVQLSQYGLLASSRPSSGPSSPMSTVSMTEEDLREDIYGTEQPDAQPDQHVSLAPLLAITAQQQLEVGLKRLVPVPLLQYLADDWRSREETDVGILVLKLCLLRLVMGQEEASLSDLYGNLATDHGSLRIRIPEKGFVVQRISKQMTQGDFQQLLRSADAGSWAFIGPGNKGMDSWLTLKTKDGRWLVLQLQSKVRTRAEAVGAASVAKEAKKGWEVPPAEDDTLMLYVTDQHAARGAPGPILTTHAVETVTVEKHESFYGVAKFIKDAIRAWPK